METKGCMIIVKNGGVGGERRKRTWHRLTQAAKTKVIIHQQRQRQKAKVNDHRGLHRATCTKDDWSEVAGVMPTMQGTGIRRC